MDEYVVLGLTGGLRDSRVLIRRCKSLEELRDVFTGGERLARRAARLRTSGRRVSKKRCELYVFRRCKPGEDCLYLVSFDVKLVRARDAGRARKDVRKPSHEYSEIKEMMYSRLCGSVDFSTYVCAEDRSADVDRYLTEVAASYHITRFYVRPLEDVDRELVRESIQKALDWVTARALTLATRVANCAPQGYGIVRKKATEFLGALASVMESARRLEARLARMGIEVPATRVVADAERYLREAIQMREERSEKLKERRRSQWR